MRAMTLNVAVVGPGAEADEAIRGVAHEVGRLLAQRGAVVVTGGLGGVMESAAAGARAAGGIVVGLLPGADHAEGNADLTVTLPTGLGEVRDALVVRGAHAVICVGGSWGTLVEVALAMRTGVPVVCVGGWRILDASGGEQAVTRAHDAASAVELALKEGSRRAGTRGGMPSS